MVPTANYVGLSAILFVLGVIGVLTRRNAIIVFMSIELMLNSANLAFVAFSGSLPHPGAYTPSEPGRFLSGAWSGLEAFECQWFYLAVLGFLGH